MVIYLIFMKFKEYLAKLNKLAKNNPSALELPVVYSKDDEDNQFRLVEYDPTVGTFVVKISEIHSVCVN